MLNFALNIEYRKSTKQYNVLMHKLYDSNNIEASVGVRDVLNLNNPLKVVIVQNHIARSLH